MTNTNTVVIEQNNDDILQRLRLKLVKEEYSEIVLIQNTRYQHYASQLDRMSIQNDIIARQYFDETGNVNFNRMLLPEHLLQELLESFHGKANRHLNTTKTLQADGSKYYYPGIAKIVRKWLQGCETCIRDKRISNAPITPHFLNLPEWDLGPDDAMQ